VIKKPKRVRISFSLSAEHAKLLTEEAKLKHISRSRLIEEILWIYLDKIGDRDWRRDFYSP
jgi:hypothetical protein